MCVCVCVYIYIYIRRPLLAGATRLGGKAGESLISYPNVFSIFNQQMINLYQCFHDQSAIDQSAVDKSAVCWSTGQQTGGKYCSTVPPGASIYHPAPRFTQLGVVLKINEISMHIQYTRKSQKWCPKTSKSIQNEIPRGT